jgi:hypothetical protein
MLAKPDQYPSGMGNAVTTALLDFHERIPDWTGTALRLHAWWETAVIPFRRGL